jgi:hypothetical protein
MNVVTKFPDQLPFLISSMILFSVEQLLNPARDIENVFRIPLGYRLPLM